MKSIEKSKLCYDIINERKAIDPVMFDISQMTSISDFFLIASGSSTRQVQAITKHLVKRMKDEGFKVHGIEGEQEGHWVLLDYGDVIIHIFYQPFRELYNLEGLWIEAPRLHVNHNGERET